MSRKSKPIDLGSKIVRIIESTRISVTCEEVAQDSIHVALRDAVPGVQREVRLSDRDRVDLMAGPVAIEVKVKKRQSRAQILKQLERYAEHDEVKAVILATADAWPGTISDLNGKPLLVASLTKGWL
ncbi:hypothetical protein VWZ88_01790 [Phaeobacter sp. JH20_36]|uniref:Uncharacterized protein n=1 Tax=Phaeobacter gallaeciensis TaxID=60890 RepID=A0AAC9Z7Q7_9RHOB|nr:hypothetical protein [Phaeobacter gallaeciensis]AHD09521.1 hypothetical protein Gal_01765 [Phaeobacter gallaeciensis DSM 26640]ATE92786.1 hypothetical protein PhaeoP11_01758 [Phaeobacter gallaeciensis]ATE97392.1 hypothetical protein PhaeoP73_02088 [Phaeobacter gallaeciensis]ATF01451.1 hypothetical protein PhaeoP75_01808 [Phaeobacter gallaeciensis]ATF05831.1 hypothetical protein PhaeoP63_01756 [Phaeobacter gallaeciensis]